MKKLVDFLLFGAIFVGLCAVGLCIETNILLGIPLDHWTFYLFIFCATLVQYNLHYLFKPETRYPTERSEWNKTHKLTQKILLALSSAGLVYSLFWLQPRHFGILMVLALLAFLYSLPLLPFKKKRLKEFGIFKIFLLSLEWTLVTVWFPADQAGIDPTSYWLVFIRRFIFMFVLCLLFDIRDYNADTSMNIRTLPVRTGVKKAYLVADFALVIFLLASIWQLLRTGDIFSFNAMFLSAASTKWLMQLSKKINNDYVYLAGVDGMMLLQALLVIVGTV